MGASDGRRGRANRELDILGHPRLVEPLERLEVPRDEVSVQHESFHRWTVVIVTVCHHPDVPPRRAPADGPARARVPVDRLAPHARAALALARLSQVFRLVVLHAKLAQAPPRLRIGRATGFADGIDSKASRAPRVSNLSALRRRRRVVHGSVDRRDVLEPKQLEGFVRGGAVRGGGHPECVPGGRSIAAVPKVFVGAARDPHLVHGDVLVETRLKPHPVARVVAVPHRFAVEPCAAVRQGLIRDVVRGGVRVVAVFATSPRDVVPDTRGVVH